MWTMRVCVPLLAAGVLYATGRHNYILFHTLVELFALSILASIGVLVLNTWRQIDNPYLLFLGIILPLAGMVNLFHMMSYKGMGVFGHIPMNDAAQFWRETLVMRKWESNTATQLWIAMRYLVSLAFLCAPFFFGRRLRPGWITAIGAAVVSLLLVAIWPLGIFPDCLVDSQGLTPFKVISEYVISGIFLAAIVAVLRAKAQFDPTVLRLIVGAIALGMAADLTFTLYSDPYQISNMAGHMVNVGSFFLIYRAILVTGFSRPQHLLYRNLQELAGRLERMNRAKDDFLAMLGHELRNPLAPIMNSLHVLGLRGAGDEAQQRTLEVIMRQTRHLSRLVDDLLDVSRITRGKVELRPERVDLVQVARHAAESCQAICKAKRHALEVRLPEEPVMLTADPARLEQVLVNLLNNAAKYTNPGGRVVLRLTAEGGAAVVTVHDNGTGLSPEMLEDIFEPFSQVERTLGSSQGGLGLGLTLVRSLVQMHGGTVSAASAGPGRGSEFTVRLPLHGTLQVHEPEPRD